jgi:hypothetical protein
VKEKKVSQMENNTGNAISEPILNVLVTKNDGWWIAQGVEYDIVAQARSLDDLEYEFERMVIVHIATCEQFGLEPFESLPPAPDEVGHAFLIARELAMRTPRLKVEDSRVPTRLAPKMRARLHDSLPSYQSGEACPV